MCCWRKPPLVRGALSAPSCDLRLHAHDSVNSAPVCSWPPPEKCDTPQICLTAGVKGELKPGWPLVPLGWLLKGEPVTCFRPSLWRGPSTMAPRLKVHQSSRAKHRVWSLGFKTFPFFGGPDFSLVKVWSRKKYWNKNRTSDNQARSSDGYFLNFSVILFMRKTPVFELLAWKSKLLCLNFEGGLQASDKWKLRDGGARTECTSSSLPWLLSPVLN